MEPYWVIYQEKECHCCWCVWKILIPSEATEDRPTCRLAPNLHRFLNYASSSSSQDVETWRADNQKVGQQSWSNQKHRLSYQRWAISCTSCHGALQEIWFKASPVHCIVGGFLGRISSAERDLVDIKDSGGKKLFHHQVGPATEKGASSSSSCSLTFRERSFNAISVFGWIFGAYQ